MDGVRIILRVYGMSGTGAYPAVGVPVHGAWKEGGGRAREREEKGEGEGEGKQRCGGLWFGGAGRCCQGSNSGCAWKEREGRQHWMGGGHSLAYLGMGMIT